MHRLTIVFQLSLYLLLWMASHILGLAEGSTVPYVLTLPLLLLSFIFTERWKLLHLPISLASVFSVLALLSAAVELISGTLEQRFLGGAHLLVYLTWIIAFQVKEQKQYWWLLAMSLMQVAVGAILTKEGFYGAWVLAYTVVALWTLTLLWLQQVLTQFSGTDQSGSQSSLSAENPSPAAGQAAAVATVRSTSSRASVLLASGSTRGGLQQDSQSRWLGLRFMMGNALTTVCALMLAAAFFFLIPRVSSVWKSQRLSLPSSTGFQEQKLTGFTQEVRLGDIGQILESTERVLELRLFDATREEQISVTEFSLNHGQPEPLFRGAVLNNYSNGHWQASERQAIPLRLPEEGAPNAVRQDVTLQQIGTSILFAMHPVDGCRLEMESGTVVLNGTNGVLMHHIPDRNHGPIVYSVFSPPQERKPETGPIPMEGTREYRQYQRRQRRLLNAYGRLPQRGLEPLIAETRRVVGNDGARDSERAHRLMTYLQDPANFSYSLTAGITDASVDPVVDFLQNRKQGHCEYFASALALMLRATGIPSRLVSGFKGGTINSFTGAFEVQQRHAHAWVEAWIDERWQILDPTPAEGRTRSVASMESSMRSFSDLKSLLKEFWGTSIVKIDLAQQRNRFYNPLKMVGTAWWQSMKGDHSAARKLAARARSFLASPENWFSVTGGLVTFTMLVMLTFAVLLYRRLRRLYRRLRAQMDADQQNNVQLVEFYERFRRMIERQGLARRPEQTQREFAEEIHQQLTPRLQAAGLAEFPRQLTDQFYQARFGHRPPAPSVLAELDRLLSALERSLNEKAEKSA